MKVLPMPGGGYAVTVSVRELKARGLRAEQLEKQDVLALLEEALPARPRDGSIQVFPGPKETLVMVQPAVERMTVLPLSAPARLPALLRMIPDNLDGALYGSQKTWYLILYIPRGRPIPLFCRRWPDPRSQVMARRLLSALPCLVSRRSIGELRSLFPTLPV